MHGTYAVKESLQSNSQNCGHLKYVWNVYGQDLQPQKTKKHIEFPSVMEQTCFISKVNPLFQLYNKLDNC